MNILLIDDEPDCLALMKFHLEGQGHEVTVCNGGAAGCQELSKRDFELIISDINMPDVTGYHVAEFCHTVKINTPLIFWSGESRVDEHLIKSLGSLKIFDKVDFEGIINFINQLQGDENEHRTIC